MLVGRVADDGHGDRAGHPCEDVARRQAEAEDRRCRTGSSSRRRSPGRRSTTARTRPSRRPRSGRGGHPGARRARRPAGPDRHGAAQVHAGRVQPLGGPRRDETGEVVARADRMDLGGAGRDDDLVGMDVEHPVRRPGDDGRTGVDGHDLVAVRGVQDEDVLARRLGLGRGRQPARAAADDGDVDLAPVHLDLRPRGVRVRSDCGTTGSGGFAPSGCRTTSRPGRPPSGTSGRRRCRPPSRGSSGSRRPGTASRHGPGRSPAPQHRERHGVARLEGDGPSVDDDPAAGRRRGLGRPAPAVSVTGASASRRGRSSGSRLEPGRSSPADDLDLEALPPGPSGVASAVGT